MRKYISTAIFIFTFVTMALSDGPLTVGMVADTASFDDAGYNFVCKAGLERAMREFKVRGEFRASRDQAEYRKNLEELAAGGCGLIIGLGAVMQVELAAVAKKYPEIKFALVDGNFQPPLPNVQSLFFSVDEVAMQAGFLAAAWADLKGGDNPCVGYVAGMQIEPVKQFVVPFQAGVERYNRQYRRRVMVKGEYIGTFEDPARGRAAAESLLDQGVSVILVAAGESGKGALAAAHARGCWGIGADTDQYYTLPAVRGSLLTSCLKRMDEAVFALVRDVLTDRFRGGGVMTGSLANGLVSLAPLREFKKAVPRNIRNELFKLRQDIKGNRVPTGWSPEEK